MRAPDPAAPDSDDGIALGIGGLAGGYTGARLQSRMPDVLIRRLVGVLVIGIGAYSCHPVPAELGAGYTESATLSWTSAVRASNSTWRSARQRARRRHLEPDETTRNVIIRHIG